tara:strand:+ start:1004 stop:1906 length:903 start_codon:yes stop_codon:yes gene_type:complete
MNKVFINRRPVTGPWGGGNKFVSGLHDYLKKHNYIVSGSLDDDVDIIFCFDPRPGPHGLWYGDFLHHKRKFGSRIIQRVGDIGTHGKPDLTKLVSESINFSDFVIFPSAWAKNMIMYDKDNCAIIENGPHSIFYNNRNTVSKPRSISLITHHWSTNPKKGFDTYKFIDEVTDFNFTFIGRLPDKFSFKNSTYIPPQPPEEISKLLFHGGIYLTASLEEAGANHVLEAMAAGLPIVYHEKGGSIPEYCIGFGRSFNDSGSLIESINHVFNEYNTYRQRLTSYTRTIDDTINEYGKIICDLM